jgi:hypothetical protein
MQGEVVFYIEQRGTGRRWTGTWAGVQSTMTFGSRPEAEQYAAHKVQTGQWSAEDVEVKSDRIPY